MNPPKGKHVTVTLGPDHVRLSGVITQLGPDTFVLNGRRYRRSLVTSWYLTTTEES